MWLGDRISAVRELGVSISGRSSPDASARSIESLFDDFGIKQGESMQIQVASSRFAALGLGGAEMQEGLALLVSEGRAETIPEDRIKRLA